ncbi:MAG TPA: DoxX family protein [Opitutales bacterium]|nr:DoxX family protein [Opitutales bacterium]
MQKSFSQKLTATSNSLALLPARLVLGLIFMAHGAQKLFGWFDGGGVEGTSKMLDSLGLGFGASSAMAVVVGAGEVLAGVLLFLGLFARIGGALVIVIMAVGIIKVHSNAFFVSSGGMEFALILLTIGIPFLLKGAGGLSIDRMLACKPTAKSE